MEDFHEDILSNILSRVPDESISNCKLVRKRWRQLLSNRKQSLGILFAFSDPGDIQLYYANYDVIKSTKHTKDFYRKRITKINLPLIESDRDEQQVIVGSCNGLVCLSTPHRRGSFYDPVYICNPFTSEYTLLPKISNNERWGTWDVLSGFGYLPSTNEYKVVRILYCADKSKGQVQVYTLGSRNGWRNVTETKHSFIYSVGILAHESLYWKDEHNNKIVAFDLKDEIFRVLPPPPCIQSPRKSVSKKKNPHVDDTMFWLIMLGGYLCLVDESDYDCIDIWSFRKNKHLQANKSSSDVIEQDYCYSDWSWSKDFSIDWGKKGRRGDEQPFALTKNNEILIWHESILKRYDLVTKSFTVILDRGSLSWSTFKGTPHMNTLVSLKDVG